MVEVNVFSFAGNGDVLKFLRLPGQKTWHSRWRRFSDDEPVSAGGVTQKTEIVASGPGGGAGLGVECVPTPDSQRLRRVILKGVFSFKDA